MQVLGKLVTESDVREVKDKARLTLETVVRDPQGVPSVLAVPLVLTLAAIAPYCPQNYVEDGNCYSTIIPLKMYEVKKKKLIDIVL